MVEVYGSGWCESGLCALSLAQEVWFGVWQKTGSAVPELQGVRGHIFDVNNAYMRVLVPDEGETFVGAGDVFVYEDNAAASGQVRILRQDGTGSQPFYSITIFTP